MKYLGFTKERLQKSESFFTAKEICQQPDCWLETFALVESYRNKIDQFLAPLLIKKGLRIILTGAGSSAFSGDLLAPFFNQLTHYEVSAVASTDLVSNPYQYLNPEQSVLLISFARSGNSPESIAAVNLINMIVKDSYHLIITCNRNGKLYQDNYQAEKTFALHLPDQTNDKGFAMTSSFSSMTLAAAIIFLNSYFDKNRVNQLADVTRKFIQSKHEIIQNLAKQSIERIVYLGSGGLKGLSQESALKILELTAGDVVATYDSPMGFRHGPKSIINQNTVIVVYLSNDDYTRKYDIDLCKEILRDGKVKDLIILSGKRELDLPLSNQIHIENLEKASDLDLAFPYLSFAQMLSFFCSFLSGRTTDNPCPSGEVNRVVKGVVIHEYKLN